jgi:hypothetical protein
MPQPPKNVKAGQRITAKNYNKVLDELRRLGKLFDAYGAGGPKPLRGDQVWKGIVVDAGPAAEADYTDGRYWIQRSKLENDENDNAASDVSFVELADGVDYRYEIITATNLAETRLDADADTVELFSHRVQVGSPVIVLKYMDEGSPGAWRYFFWQQPSDLQRMRVKSVADDYVRCVTYDGSVEGADTINVAKPYDLRRSPFDGNAVNGVTYHYTSENVRTANDSNRTVLQTVREEYYVDSEIYASYRPKGDTGVTSPEVYWIDSNQAARRWGRLSFLLENCQDSTDKMLVSGDLQDYVGFIVRLHSTGELCWKVSEAQCDCDLEEVTVSASFSTCEDCLPDCYTLTPCSGETGLSAFDVRTAADIENFGTVQYDGGCYTVSAPITCAGTELELQRNQWIGWVDCDACRLVCVELTCCDTSDTMDVKARGLLDWTGGTKSISVVGEPGCWTVGNEETCAAHVLVEFVGFTDCDECNDAICCYATDPCPDQVGAPEVFSAYSVGECYDVGDIVKVTVDDTTWCYEITSVLEGRDTCEIPCGNAAGSGGADDRFYEITDETLSPSCEECTPCWNVLDCADGETTDVIRGEFAVGKIYRIEETCWEVTGPAACDAGSATDADNSDVFETCLECESAEECYTLTPCGGGDTTLVFGDLAGVTTICWGGASYTVSAGTCDDSEVEVGAYTRLVDCDECPEGYVKITVVTAFNSTTCVVTTEDVCVKDIGCGA